MKTLLVLFFALSAFAQDFDSSEFISEECTANREVCFGKLRKLAGEFVRLSLDSGTKIYSIASGSNVTGDPINAIGVVSYRLPEPGSLGIVLDVVFVYGQKESITVRLPNGKEFKDLPVSPASNCENLKK